MEQVSYNMLFRWFVGLEKTTSNRPELRKSSIKSAPPKSAWQLFGKLPSRQEGDTSTAC